MEQKVSFFDAIEANKRNSLILLVFSFALLMAVGWAFSEVLGLGDLGFVISLFAVLLYMGFAYFQGADFVLSMSGARPLERNEYPFVYHTVDGLAAAAGIPAPKVYIIDDPAMNAFATGKDPKNSYIAVTRGLVENLKRDELEGVIAHEISHIANYDIRFMLYAVVMVGAIALLSQMASRSLWYGGRGGSGRRGGGNAIGLIIALVLIILAPIFAELIRFAISRQREHLADANAAKLTRYPDGLIGALKRISGTPEAAKVATANDATAPLYIVSPFAGKLGHLFSTHPPIEERIKRLAAM